MAHNEEVFKGKQVEEALAKLGFTRVYGNWQGTTTLRDASGRDVSVGARGGEAAFGELFGVGRHLTNLGVVSMPGEFVRLVQGKTSSHLQPAELAEHLASNAAERDEWLAMVNDSARVRTITPSQIATLHRLTIELSRRLHVSESARTKLERQHAADAQAVKAYAEEAAHSEQLIEKLKAELGAAKDELVQLKPVALEAQRLKTALHRADADNENLLVDLERDRQLIDRQAKQIDQLTSTLMKATGSLVAVAKSARKKPAQRKGLTVVGRS